MKWASTIPSPAVEFGHLAPHWFRSLPPLATAVLNRSSQRWDLTSRRQAATFDSRCLALVGGDSLPAPPGSVASCQRGHLVSFRRGGARDGSCAILGAVRRAVLVILLAMLTFNVSGLAAVCGDAPCDDESCPGDLSGGECAPNCHFCSCCSLPKVAGLDHRRPRCASGAHDVVDRIGSTPAVARAGRHPARPQAPPRVANRSERTGCSRRMVRRPTHP